MIVRPMREDEWDLVAELIHSSTNAWYERNLNRSIFPADDPASCRVFPEVYEALDPRSCHLLGRRSTSALPVLALL